MKKTVLMLLCIVLCLSGCAEQKAPQEPDTLQIVTTIFPAYDFARAAAGEGVEVTLLLPPGTESHSYEPTPADIMAVQSCDLFICLGGESDTWVETILSAVEPKGEVLRMVDCVELLPEEHDHGEAEHDHDHSLGAVVGMDEHVWTAPGNAAEITRKIGERLAALDGINEVQYRKNAADYAEKLAALDDAFEAFFSAQPDKTVVFGDRFPLRYFAEAYDLDYYAAFPSCSTQTEPSAATIAFLTEKVREENIKTVWYIEFSNHLVADSIAEAAGVKTAMFHTCHNVSAQEIEAGATYLSLMEGNLEALRENF
ncbi:MAG: zinc ABC transporter substrate-binding protein [Ruminococcaceae bacterium]|nr:zinc ABC transporter substrate-binding protein [Oscillospiraceae bacterium]